MKSAQSISLQDIIKDRQQANFVGRKNEISSFTDNLKLTPENPNRKFIFNIFGEGGVGKTWLLSRFRRLLEDADFITAWTDEAEKDIPSVLGHFKEQFEKQGYNLKNFAKRYHDYRQLRKELEADPEAPKGTAAFVGQTLVKAGARLARHTHVGGILFSFIDEETFAAQLSEWGSYVVRKLTNKDEILLMLEPVETLTHLFLYDLSNLVKQRSVALLFDTYERTCGYLDNWLRSTLDGRFGIVPANIMIGIAGRHQLDKSFWESYDDLVTCLNLKPFTDKEAREYLSRKGITDSKEMDFILRISSCLPLLLATLTIITPSKEIKTSSLSSTAVECFLKWVDNTTQRKLIIDGAIPRRLNLDILRILIKQESVSSSWDWLKEMPFVDENEGGWVYHEVVRTQIIYYKHRESPQSWIDLHERLANYYEEMRDKLGVEKENGYSNVIWQEFTVEALYHRLCQDPNKYLTYALNGFLASLEAEQDYAKSWAKTMHQAGQDSENLEVENLGAKLIAEKTEEALPVFTELLKNPEIEKKWKPTALVWRAKIYKSINRHDDALEDFRQALQLMPNNIFAFVQRALFFSRDLKRYEEALADLNKAIELAPNNGHWVAHRGEVYKEMGKFELALADFDKSLELNYNDHWVHDCKGALLREMNRYNEALDTFTQAIKTNPKCGFCFAERGEVYRLLKQYQEALSDFDKSIVLEPKDAWAIRHRGLLYMELTRYDSALKDFDRALQFEPDHWTYEQRGLVLRTLGRYAEAIDSLTKAHKESPDCSVCIAERGQTYYMMKNYEKAIADFDRTIELSPDYHFAYEQKGLLLRALGRYEEAIESLTKAEKTRDDCSSCIVERGRTYFLLKYYSQALADYDRAIEKSPNYHWAYEQRGIVLTILGRYEDALDSLTQAEKLNTKCINCIVARARVYFLMKEYRKAMADIMHVISNFTGFG